MATIRDVAKASGVSIATVSHVLNNRLTKVSPETRERVFAAVRMLRYRPTALEVNQKAAATRNLGFLVEDMSPSPFLSNQYFGHILDGVIEAAALKGYSITITIERMWPDVGHAIRRSYDGHCDGVILLAPTATSASIRPLWERGIPLVSIGSTVALPGVSMVDVDNVGLGMDAARQLVSQGHRRFAFLGGNAVSIASLERIQGFLTALHEAGVAAEDILVASRRPAGRDWHSRPKLSEAVAATTPFLDRIVEFTAKSDLEWAEIAVGQVRGHTGLLAFSDDSARLMVRELAKAGICIPRDASVIGVDDNRNAVSEAPHLTTYHQPLHLIGRTATHILLDKIHDHTHPDQAVRFMPELVWRDSVGPAPEPTA